MSLGEKIKYLRIKNNFTQMELGNKLGISSKMISKWEIGYMVPNVEYLLVISRIFDIPIEALINDDYDVSIPYKKYTFKLPPMNLFVDKDLIIKKAQRILEDIEKINFITSDKQNKIVFEWNKDMFQLSINIKKIVESETEFCEMSCLLYRSIYESSGTKNNRIYTLAKYYNIDSRIIDYVKSFRNLNSHKLNNGEEKIDKVIEYFKKNLNKKYPACKEEWSLLQKKIYCDIVKLLDNLYEKMNNDLENSYIKYI